MVALPPPTSTLSNAVATALNGMLPARVTVVVMMVPLDETVSISLALTVRPLLVTPASTKLLNGTVIVTPG